MTGAPYIRFFPDDWLAGTQDLSLEERGALITIVAMTASTGVAPADNYARLARRFGCTKGRSQKLIASLVEQGKLTVSEGAILNKRAQKETKISQKMSEKQSEKANAKWAKSGAKSNKNNAREDATAEPRHSHGTCQPEPEPDPYKGVNPLEPPARRRMSKGCRIPDDFVCDLDWAVAQGLLRQTAETEAATFRDYWISQTGAKAVKADWPAVWRNWVRRKVQERPSNVAALPSKTQPTPVLTADAEDFLQLAKQRGLA
ncbi:MAG: DUF1376 domain-containing protein [Pseudomonadota bacterium]